MQASENVKDLIILSGNDIDEVKKEITEFGKSKCPREVSGQEFWNHLRYGFVILGLTLSVMVFIGVNDLYGFNLTESLVRIIHGQNNNPDPYFWFAVSSFVLFVILIGILVGGYNDIAEFLKNVFNSQAKKIFEINKLIQLLSEKYDFVLVSHADWAEYVDCELINALRINQEIKKSFSNKHSSNRKNFIFLDKHLAEAISLVFSISPARLCSSSFSDELVEEKISANVYFYNPAALVKIFSEVFQRRSSSLSLETIKVTYWLLFAEEFVEESFEEYMVVNSGFFHWLMKDSTSQSRLYLFDEDVKPLAFDANLPDFMEDAHFYKNRLFSDDIVSGLTYIFYVNSVDKKQNEKVNAVLLLFSIAALKKAELNVWLNFVRNGKNDTFGYLDNLLGLNSYKEKVFKQQSVYKIIETVQALLVINKAELAYEFMNSLLKSYEQLPLVQALRASVIERLFRDGKMGVDVDALIGVFEVCSKNAQDGKVNYKLDSLKEACWIGTRIISHYLQLENRHEYKEGISQFIQATENLLELFSQEIRRVDLQELEPNILWHYHNDMANLFEKKAECCFLNIGNLDTSLVTYNLESARKHYEASSRVIGVDLKWLSGSDANLAYLIYYALVKLEVDLPSWSLDEAEASVNKSIGMKIAIYDEDELPVVKKMAGWIADAMKDKGMQK